MARRRLHPLALAVTLLAPSLVSPPSVQGAPARAALDEGLFRELRWRPIGPFRGGRTKAATGVRGKPGLFYIGVVNGGVWKTTDYGRTWQPIFDDQPTGSIGADRRRPLESRRDLRRQRRGHAAARPLDRRRDLQVGGRGQDLAAPRPARRPADPADRRGPERREEALRRRARPPVRAERGAGRLPLDRRGRDVPEGPLPRRGHGRRRRGPRPGRPRTSCTRSCGRRGRGRGRTASSRGEGSGLYKSTDGGRSWRPLRSGLPTFAEGLGRIGITVAPSDPRRLYATVEARDKAGIYRSDDARRDVVARERGPARGRPPRRRRRGARPPDRTPTSSSSRRSSRGSPRTAGSTSRPSAARRAATTTSASGSTPTART